MPSFTYDGVHSFGRALSEYQAMFLLDLEQMRGKRLLDCPAGCNSFGAEAASHGIEVIAVDPLFRLPWPLLQETAAKDIRHIVERSFQTPDLLIPEKTGTQKQVLTFRQGIYEIFSEDFQANRSHRYLSAQLPCLPFRDETFELILSGHFLFCYQEQFSLDFHLQALQELIRVTRGEVRIYPIRGLDTELSRFLEPCRKAIAQQGIQSEIRKTAYEVVRNWGEMLVLQKA